MNSCRRALGSLIVALTLGVAGLVGVAAAGAATAAPAQQHTCPTNDTSSCISTHGGGQTHLPGTHGHGTTPYCVSGYKPGTVVTITNPATGKSQTVTVNANGNACTPVSLGSGCQTITATGTGASGTRTSSSGRLCVTTKASGGNLPFTGSTMIVPGTAIGLILLVVGSALVVATRRRRSGGGTGGGRHRAVPTA